MKHRKLVTLVLAVAVIVSLLVIGCAPKAAPPEEVKLKYGVGCPKTSSYYAVHATIAKLVEEIPGISTTLVMIRGSEAIVTEIYKGRLDWGGSGGLILFYQSIRGLGKWEGHKQPNILRWMFMTHIMQTPITVREDAGITCLADLAGKKFSWGVPGSTTQILGSQAFDALGIKYDPFVGSLDDAVAAIKDGRIVGYCKAAPAHHLDASMIDIKTRVPITMIGFTDEEVEKVKAKYPYIAFRKLPAGWYAELPELGELNVMATPLLVMTSRDMPEDVGYKLTKQIVGNWQQLIDVFEPCGASDPLDTPSMVAGTEGAYMHPGCIRYFRERGVEIPESIIPPEMK